MHCRTEGMIYFIDPGDDITGPGPAVLLQDSVLWFPPCCQLVTLIKKPSLVETKQPTVCWQTGRVRLCPSRSTCPGLDLQTTNTEETQRKTLLLHQLPLRSATETVLHGFSPSGPETQNRTTIVCFTQTVRLWTGPRGRKVT